MGCKGNVGMRIRESELGYGCSSYVSVASHMQDAVIFLCRLIVFEIARGGRQGWNGSWPGRHILRCTGLFSLHLCTISHVPNQHLGSAEFESRKSFGLITGSVGHHHSHPCRAVSSIPSGHRLRYQLSKLRSFLPSSLPTFLTFHGKEAMSIQGPRPCLPRDRRSCQVDLAGHQQKYPNRYAQAASGRISDPVTLVPNQANTRIWMGYDY